MKKISFLTLFLLSFSLGFSQGEDVAEDTKVWTKGGMGGITLNEVGLFNWAAGGTSNITLIGRLNTFANFAKNGHTVDNSLDLGYGLIKNNFIFQPKAPITKAEDKIEFNSKYGKKAWSDKFYYGALFNFTTQFAPGYANIGDADYMSKFFSPAYFRLGLGIDYRPCKVFSVFFAPLSAKMTVVTDPRLASEGAFGVNMKDDQGEFRFGSGLHTRAELGASLNALFKMDITKNIGVESKLGLFSNYIVNPQFIDVDWQNGIVAKINDYISVNFFTHLIYDYDIMLGSLNKDGTQEIDPATSEQVKKRAVQFKETFGVGFSYKF